MNTGITEFFRHESFHQAITEVMQTSAEQANRTTDTLSKMGFVAVAGCWATEPAAAARELSYSSLWQEPQEVILAPRVVKVAKQFQRQLGQRSLRQVALWQHPQQNYNITAAGLHIPGTGSETDGLLCKVVQYREEAGNVYGNPQRAA